MGSAPLPWQKQAPTRNAADKYYEDRVKSGVMRTDANDMLYYFDSSREYKPAPMLDKIKAPLIAVNSADAMINPPESWRGRLSA
jgi:homoserine O-acetyltransferase